VDYNRSTEIAEMRFLRPKEAESEERTLDYRNLFMVLYGWSPYFKLQMSRPRIIVNIKRKVCDRKYLWSILRYYPGTSLDGMSKTARSFSGQSLTETKN
jgi:hypothetical protein